MEWISVNDNLPEEEGEYLVYLKRDLKYGRRIVFSTWFKGDWLGINGSSWPGMPKPKYWQPLPPPPSSHNSDYAKSCETCLYGVDGCKHEPPCITGAGKPYYKKRDFA